MMLTLPHVSAHRPGPTMRAFLACSLKPVSYTHLDVYKRQVLLDVDRAGFVDLLVRAVGRYGEGM